LFQFQFEGLDKGWVPGDMGRRRACLLFQREPPLQRVEETAAYSKAEVVNIRVAAFTFSTSKIH
jgi:hypothetical protein